VSILLCYQFSSLTLVASIFLPFSWLEMTLIGRKPFSPLSSHPSRAAKDAIDLANLYEDYVPEVDKSQMSELEK
jgi:hypothetical protein